MPSHFGPEPPPDSDSDEEEDNQKGPKRQYDQYGEVYEDYGFLSRAEEKKELGNKHFKRERYEEALKQYESALDDCITLAGDPSIHVSKKKWIDICAFRSTVRMNKSTCFFKVKDYRMSCSCAIEAIMGNASENGMFTDHHIKRKMRDGERKEGTMGAQILLEKRLPRWLRAKAWFRMSQCYLKLEYTDRAKEALAKSLEMAEDDLIDDIQMHMQQIEIAEKQMHARQKKQFMGFFDKLQERGGYIEETDKEMKKNQWDSLNYEEKFKRIEELDDSDDENQPPQRPQQQQKPAKNRVPTAAERKEAMEMLKRTLGGVRGLKIEEAAQDFEKQMEKQNTQQIDQSFDDYQRRKAAGLLDPEPEPQRMMPPPVMPQTGGYASKPTQRPATGPFKLPFRKEVFADPRSSAPPPKQEQRPTAADHYAEASAKRNQALLESRQAEARELADEQARKDQWKARVEELDDSDEDP